MKALRLCGVLAILPLTWSAETTTEQKPLPRLRLEISGDNAVAVAPTKAGNATLTMPRVVVNDRTLVREPERLTETKGAFSAGNGGTLLQSDRNGALFELGAWRWENVDQEGEKFRPSRTQVEMEVMRVRW